MINEFHFDHKFLENETLVDHEFFNTHLIKMWADFGCLYYPFDFHEDYMNSLVYHDPRYAQDWQLAFSDLKKCNIEQGYKCISQHDSVTDVFSLMNSYGVKTTLMKDDDANKLEVENFFSSSELENEVVKANYIHKSVYFNKSEEYSKKDLGTKESLEDIWKTRFHGLAKHSRLITIIDRYLFENLEQDIGTKITSIKKFADFLRPYNNKFSLCIYSVGGDKDSPRHECIENYFRLNKTAKDKLGEVFSYIEISSCSDDKFMVDSHDRFIRFDDFVVSIGTGFEIFRSNPIRTTTFSVKNHTHTCFTETTSSMNPKRLWVYRW